MEWLLKLRRVSDPGGGLIVIRAECTDDGIAEARERILREIETNSGEAWTCAETVPFAPASNRSMDAE